jgi:DNA-directed RNA polymerase specialized sigma24 family protein
MSSHDAEPSTQDADYEVFRRAIVDQNGDAWMAIYQRYRSLLVSWARHCSTTPQIGEYYDDIADQAFARAWAALSLQHFTRFPSLAKLLAYLRTCVAAVVIDYARARAARERMFLKLEVEALATPEELVLGDIERADLWQLVQRLVETEQERTILFENFVLDLPPRIIMARHPELFTHISTVYFAKRNLLARLQRNHELQHLRQELFSA